jgi:hypothetical protein
MDANPVQDAADRLSAKLDALDLDPDERAVLTAICAAGADSVQDVDGEVTGFSFATFPPLPATDDQTDQVTFGLRRSGTIEKSTGRDFLRFTFGLG